MYVRKIKSTRKKGGGSQ